MRGIKTLLPAAVATAVLASVVPSGAHAGARTDPADARGPLDLAAVGLTQDVKRLKLRLATHVPMPRMGELVRYPSRVGSDDERYLCAELRSRKLGRRLLCLGGETQGGKMRLGYSSVAQTGRTRKLHEISARFRKRGDRRAQVSLPMRKTGLRPRRVHWRVMSGWNDQSCLRAPPPAKDLARNRAIKGDEPPVENECLDLAPNEGTATERLYRVRRVGCARDERSVVRNGSRTRKRIALTFDDGPSAYTSRILSILNHRNADGTFFVVGSQIGGRTGVMRRALATGHELGNHSTYHRRHPSKTDMQRTSSAIKGATGFRPCTFRPPYGALNGTVASNARALGMSTILWDTDTNDWTTPGPGVIYRRAVAARAGSIVLMHDGGGSRSQTVAALPGIIRKLRSRGFKLVTVTELLRERFIWREVH